MSKILELQQRAKSLHEQHQQNIEEKLQSGIQQIFSDTERTLSEKVQSLSKSIEIADKSLKQQQSKATDSTIQQIKKDAQIIRTKHSEETSQIINLIATQQQQITAEQQQAFNEILKVQKQEMEQFKASLSEFNDWSRQTANQVTIKSELLKSNIGMIAVFSITLIATICLSFVCWSKYSEMDAKEARLKQITSTTEQKIEEYNNITAELYKLKHRSK